MISIGLKSQFSTSFKSDSSLNSYHFIKFCGLMNVQSLDQLKKSHKIESELLCIPYDWWGNKNEDYDKSFKQVLGKLKIIDSMINHLLKDPDEDELVALGAATSSHGTLASVYDLKFQHYLPSGKVQLQRDLIKQMLQIARGKISVSNGDFDKELAEIRYETEWEKNPPIGQLITAGDSITLRLRSSINLFDRYLAAAEREFYKQRLSSILGRVLLEYHNITFPNKNSRRLISWHDWSNNYSRLERTTDNIYYGRAMAYLTEVRNLWEFLDKNSLTKGWLIREDDLQKLR